MPATETIVSKDLYTFKVAKERMVNVSKVPVGTSTSLDGFIVGSARWLSFDFTEDA